jgi:hypothetical protein
LSKLHQHTPIWLKSNKLSKTALAQKLQNTALEGIKNASQQIKKGNNPVFQLYIKRKVR